MADKNVRELSPDEMDKVSGGSDGDYELTHPVCTYELYPVTCMICGQTSEYDTPNPESCKYCGMPI